MKAQHEGCRVHIPTWAEKAFSQLCPCPAYGGDEPDSTAICAWQHIDTRFRKNWAFLKPECWTAPNDRIRQLILEIALEVALELGIGKSPKRTLEAARQLDDLNNKISTKANDIEALFRQRQQLLNDYGLRDRTPGAIEREPDPYSFFGALEVVAKQSELTDWRFVFSRQIEEFLACGHTPRRKPTWADMFQAIANRDCGSIGACLSGCHRHPLPVVCSDPASI